MIWGLFHKQFRFTFRMWRKCHFVVIHSRVIRSQSILQIPRQHMSCAMCKHCSDLISLWIRAKRNFEHIKFYCNSWWRHQMETFSALLANCAGNSPVPGEFHTQRPVTRSFDDFFDLHPNKRLSKQRWGWWFETPPCPLRCHRNVCDICPWPECIFRSLSQFLVMWYFVHSVNFHLCTQMFNTLRPGQDGHHFPDDIFKCTFMKENDRNSDSNFTEVCS